MKRMPFDRAWFEEWRDPEEFENAVNECDQLLEVGEIFKPEYQYLRDAMYAGDFALLYLRREHCLVRLSQPHDFKLRRDEGDLEFELVEADRAGRKRGNEYKCLADPEEPSMEEEYNQAREAIVRIVAKKAGKYYSTKPHLVVRLNLWYEEDAGLLAKLTAPWKDTFLSIWIMSTGKATQVWPTICTFRSSQPLHSG